MIIVINVSSTNKSFGQAFSSGKLLPPILSILFYPSGRAGRKCTHKAKSEIKSFLPSFFQKAGGVKGKSPCRRPQTAKFQGVRGRSPCLSIRSKKFFVKLFPKKVWSAASRQSKFPVNCNGRLKIDFHAKNDKSLDKWVIK
ncbi:MAG: hypothetical protein ACI4JM_11845 [Oscillospiraceae bacterium]